MDYGYLFLAHHGVLRPAGHAKRRTEQSQMNVQDRTGYLPFFALSFLCIITTGATVTLLKFRYGWDGKDLIIFLPVLVIGLTGWYVTYKISNPPLNNVMEYLESSSGAKSDGDEHQKGNKRILVCVGDSLTHGRCSDNWVDRLIKNQEVPLKGDLRLLQVVNAAQNNICTHTILRERVHLVEACKPDFIFIMIGTNDLMCMYRDDWAKTKEKMWCLPETPNLEVYERNLDSILEHLLLNTRAKIGLATLPPMGEQLSSKANSLVRKANEIITKVSTKHNDKLNESASRVVVLDIHECLKAEITSRRAGNTTHTAKFHPVDYFMIAAVFMCTLRYCFGLSWVASSRLLTRNTVMSDSLHLNEEGGSIVLKIVADWLEKSSREKEE